MKWQNKRFTNIITRKSKMCESNKKIRDPRILWQENGTCEKSNEKIRDSWTLSKKIESVKIQMRK